MKKYLTFLILISTCAIAQQPKQAGFRIEGHLTGLPDNSVVSLSDANKPTDTLARANVKAGVFILTGRVNEPNLFVLNYLGIKKKSSLFIGNEPVKMTGSADLLSAVQITGSTTETDFLAFEKMFNQPFARLNQLSQMANAPGSSNEKRDSVGEAYQQVAMQIQMKVDSFLQNRKSSYVSPFLLVVTNQLSDDVFLLEKRYNALAPQVQGGMYGSYIFEQINNGKVGAIGTAATEFSQPDTAGQIISLSSFKGKYVLVDFWASWCKPCRMENPNVVAAYQRFKAKNFTVLGISLDRSRDPWVKAIQEDNLGWSQVSDLKFWSNAVALQYKVQAIPQNFLIDPNGKIIAKNLRGADLDSKLCALLGCN